MTDKYADTLYIEDVSVGDSSPEVIVEDLERPDFVRYAGASGDFNPIHYSEPFAKSAGNPSVFGQGMFTAGVLSHMVSEWVGLQNLRSYSARFVDRVWPEDTITTRGEVTEVNDGGRIQADVWVENQEGTRVIEGSIVAELPSSD
jgi:peroxisomal enoyl-CoA hydratase 2